jgi:putative transposase
VSLAQGKSTPVDATLGKLTPKISAAPEGRHDRHVQSPQRTFHSPWYAAALMGHTYCSSLYHCVFSTKGRRKTITPDLQDRLWTYIGGIARENGMTALAVGGADDHAHLLVEIPATLAVSTAMREIKRGSSLWMHEAMPQFAWQEGYGAFSIGHSQIEPTVRYIAGQQEHHRRRDFQAEFLAILKKHRIEYDPRYVWG